MSDAGPASDVAGPLPDAKSNSEPAPDVAPPSAGRGSARRVLRRTLRRTLRRAGTPVAGLLVAFALLAPDRPDALTAAGFVRLPAEALLAGVLILALRGRARRAVAAAAGAVIGLLAIVKAADLGFQSVLARPFNLVSDWYFLRAGVDFVAESAGPAGAVGAVAGAVLLAVAVLVLMTWSALRLAGAAARRRTASAGALGVLAVTWVICALLGAQLAPGTPVAALAADRLLQVRTSLRDQEEFQAALRQDPFRATPGEALLAGLRGKDVLLAFVESYGRDAVQDQEFAGGVGAVLAEGDRRLRAAGYAARSGFLTSPTIGGGSWLAHATLLSGRWVNDQQRYQATVESDRLTLNGAFRRAGWRTVGVMPGVTRAWPEGAFFGYDQVYASWNLGYRGPGFNWGTVPDQFTLESFQRAERAKKDHPPVMAEVALVSSHAPWAPIPRMVGWDELGDGSVFRSIRAAGQDPDQVWSDPARVRAEYRRSIEYSLTGLLSYVERYGDDDLVLVFLGDHQPAPLVTGPGASRDVPITIVAKDRAVLDRISGWGWQDGLRPGPGAPVWPMDTFRDRFLTAFGGAPAPSRPGR
ncbi:sulfatase-like hydrolase/transferase [Sphaerisporangium rufum]|uniref:sulfatase-like hydrolase/transferase n=1 Tax=Sphaerisporangium rufum TaxID=1381558 RepID=UPI0019517224|nr:sulfatase-like hydrolase/transferase [Sphaerisporangium rufum]